MALYVALGLCALLAALLVYRYDLYEREPWYMVALAIVLGAAGMRLVGTVELVSLGFVDTQVAVAALAALHEEAARLAIVIAIAFVFPRQFNDPMDGIVYGSMVGLGMALEESFFLLGLLEAPQTALASGGAGSASRPHGDGGHRGFRRRSRPDTRCRVGVAVSALRARRASSSISCGTGLHSMRWMPRL